MELVLIRHGQAEERSGDQTDEERNLTAEGRKSLSDSLAGYGCFLQGCGELIIWSSPMNRALQTAEIVAREFRVKEIRQVDCIASGDFDNFAQELSQMEPTASDCCLVVVGHEPWLGLWSDQLCGIALPFKKGAAAGFKVDPTVLQESELSWFVQPRILRRIGR